MWEFIEKSGIDLNNEAQVAEAKKTYRKLYKREHSRQMRRANPEVIVRLNLQEWLTLEKLAKDYQKPVGTMVKLCYLAFMAGHRQLPRPKSTESLKQMLRIIQSDLRMLSKHIHRLEDHELAEVVKALEGRYQRLEDQFSLFMAVPQKPR